MLDERGHLAVAFSAGVVACSCVGSRKDGGGGETGLVQLRNRHGRREDMRDYLTAYDSDSTDEEILFQSVLRRPS